MSSLALPACAAVIVAGGSGNRFGGDKLTVPVAGKPVVVWSLLAFARTTPISSIVLVVPAGREDEFMAIVQAEEIGKPVSVVSGGAHRTESVIRGLSDLPASIEIVAIHDAARPLISPVLITRCLEVAASAGSSAAAVRVSDTLHLADQEGCAMKTVDRTGLWAMQTPQVFPMAPLANLLEMTMNRGIRPTDEVTVALFEGWKVPFVENQEPNPKVTWPGDLDLVEALLLARLAGT
jgi:2-C-methyl-D-erythritol 4-phosphate cytidylyltransferase